MSPSPAGRTQGVVARLRDRARNGSGLTPSGYALLVASVLSWLLARVAGGRPLYLLAYGGIAVLAVSWALGRRSLPLEGRRTDPRPRLAEGETLRMTIGLTAKRRLSTLVLEERVPALLGEPPRASVASIEPGETAEHSYELTCGTRGAYTLGPLVVRWGDPFGLTQREMVLAEPVEVLVHPTIERVQDRPLTRLWEDPPIRPPVSKPWPEGMEFYGMRDYAPGDDLRRVVWRAFARTGRLLVRESEQGITDRITIVMDQDRRAHVKGDVSPTFEAACTVAASLGVRHLREGYSVTLEGSGERLAGPLRGGTAPMLLLDVLARAERTREPLTDAIMRLVRDPRRDAHIVVVTPRIDDEAVGRLKLLLDRGASVLVAGLVWDDAGVESLGKAAALGCQVVEVRPGASLAHAFARDTGVRV